MYVYVGANTYFFLVPFTQRLMSSRQNQNLYSTLLVEQNSFLNPLYVDTCVSCLLLPTLALHIVRTMAYNAQHRLAELGGNLTVCQLETRHSISNIDVV